MSKFKIGDLLPMGKVAAISVDSVGVRYRFCGYMRWYYESELVKEEPKMKEWPCNEIEKENQGWHYSGGVIAHAVPDRWNYCPDCSASRPEPKEETLEAIIKEQTFICLGENLKPSQIARITQAIREHLKGKEDEIRAYIIKGVDRYCFPETATRLTKDILRTLGVE